MLLVLRNSFVPPCGSFMLQKTQIWKSSSLVGSYRLTHLDLILNTGTTTMPKRYVSTVGKSRGRLVIVGSGWAGFKLLESIDQKSYDTVIISPRNYFLFTPLLASTCVGTLEFRAIVEPIRRQGKLLSKYQGPSLKYYEASVESIDFLTKRVQCVSVLDDNIERFSLGYDKLVLACGAISNTFNIPGVHEHACFLKDINDARKIRYRIMECFEKAQQPGLSEAKISQLLHFVVVGGGPTGVEFSAELHDFITEDLKKLYPQFLDKIQMTLIDVAPKILSTFDVSLSEYTAMKFSRKGIVIRTGTSVTKVEPDGIIIKDGSRIPFGLLVWATGLAPNPLIKSIEVIPKDRSGRLVTDGYFRVHNPYSTITETNASSSSSNSNLVMKDVFAIGDCATIKEYDLPCTAQVAKQKAKYLAKVLNLEPLIPLESNKPFSYKDMGSMAYIGEWRAIAGFNLAKGKKWNESGLFVWLLWRSAYFSMSISWRNKVLIPVYWMLAWVFGRDISHLK